MSRSWVVVVVMTHVLAGTVSRGESAELHKLFPREADVFVEHDGLSRLVLPADVLVACRPDLSDLRLFDSRGRETPFLVDAGKEPPGTLELTQRFAAPILDVAREEVRREDGPPLRREAFEIGLPDEAPQTGHWVLVIETRAGELVARVRVEGLDEGGEAASLLTDGSVFRLRAPSAAEKLRLPLPPFRAERLRVVLETEHGFWLDPAFRLDSARTLERGGRVAVPLEALSSRGGDGTTIVSLSRPRGIVPDLLRVETSTATFDRSVTVWDDGPVSVDTALGKGRVFRVEALVPIGEQEVELLAARGDRLRVEIDDGDSPPLAGLEFDAVIRQPSLIFSLPSDGSGQARGTLRFGGGRAHAPRYDLAGLLPPPVIGATGKRAEAAALLYDPAVVRAARLGGPRANPAYDGAPALAFAMHAGAELDRRVFSHARRLTVPAADEGLSRLRLDPADLAVASDDLSDLRVADDSSRQWPYLLEREAVNELVQLEVGDPERSAETSTYELVLPVSALRFDRLLLDTDATFFDRTFELEAVVGEDDDRTLSRGRLRRPIGDPRPVSIEVAPARVSSLRLIVEDGDDAPLVFRTVHARVLLPELYLTAPEGRYTLLLGAPDQSSPRYELERVGDVVLAVKASRVEVGPLENNRDYSLGARMRGRGLGQNTLLWVALIAAVAVLVFLTMRLARRETTRSG